jgi:putative methylase
MGEHAQKRIIRKLDLERFLSKIAPQPSPNAQLEQYTISPSVASSMLYITAYANNDIIGKTVLDLGCGTGRLALGASYLGADNVVGVDVDRLAVKTAVQNSFKVGLAGKVQWVIGDIAAIMGRFDTVLQNPPFGVQTREADRAFLVKALEVGNRVYSLHNHPETDKQLIKQLKSSNGFLRVSPSPFLEKLALHHNGVVKAVYAMPMNIPKMFDFHTKIKHEFVVDLYVIERVSIE